MGSIFPRSVVGLNFERWGKAMFTRFMKRLVDRHISSHFSRKRKIDSLLSPYERWPDAIGEKLLALVLLPTLYERKVIQLLMIPD